MSKQHGIMDDWIVWEDIISGWHASKHSRELCRLWPAAYSEELHHMGGLADTLLISKSHHVQAYYLAAPSRYQAIKTAKTFLHSSQHINALTAPKLNRG